MKKEKLCIINWKDGIRPPGSDFNAKKLGVKDLYHIARFYINTILSGGKDYKAFSVVH